jgi:hypothetical protein
MAGSAKDAWDEVGEHFAGVGRRLSDRYKSLGSERPDATPEDQEKVKEAIRTVTAQLDRAFTSLGDTLRDPEAQAGLKKAVGSLGDALTATFSEAAERIRSRTSRGGDTTDTTDVPPPPAPPSPSSES